jgi:hypothetical protein
MLPWPLISALFTGAGAFAGGAPFTFTLIIISVAAVALASVVSHVPHLLAIFG